MKQPRLSVLTNRGVQRQENQDAVLALRLGDGHAVIAVADGLGGLANGAIASRHALQRVRATLRSCEQDTLACITEALKAANDEFVQVAEGDPAKAMGTTACGLFFGEGTVDAFNIGDSRAYRLRGGELTQLTADHNVVADKVRRGSITAEEAATDPGRHQLTRCVGVDPDFELDTAEPVSIEPGDRYLVCTDGLHGPLATDTIRTIVAAAADPLSAGARLIDAANKAGGPDNIAVGLAFFD